MSIQNLCGFSSLPRRLFLSVSVPTFELQRREIFSCCKKVFGSAARRGGGRRACCTHFLATDTPGSQLPHRQECASSTPGRCRIHPPASQRWVGGADSPPGKGPAHLAGISSFISSPINSQIGCHHRLSIHHLRWRLGANTTSKYLAPPKNTSRNTPNTPRIATVARTHVSPP